MKLIKKIPLLILICLALYLLFSVVIRKAIPLLRIPEENIIQWVSISLSIFFSIFFYIQAVNLKKTGQSYYIQSAYLLIIKSLVISIAVTTLVCFIGTQIVHAEFMPILALYSSFGLLTFISVQLIRFFWIRYLCRIGYCRRNILIIGDPDIRLPLASLIDSSNRMRNYSGMLRITDDSCVWTSRSRTQHGFPHDSHRIKQIILQEHIGEIMFFLGNQRMTDLIHEMAIFCRNHKIDYCLVPSLKELPHKNPWNIIFPYMPILERYSTDRNSIMLYSAKRAIDLCISIFALLIFLPIGLIISLLIKLEDGGPIFFITQRIGKLGKPIRFYKFRTMMINAEEEKQKLLEYNERGDGPLFKMEKDPRVTRIGHYLRKYSLDEFPQLFNVVIGNMSLVGPRPHLPEEVAQYSDLDNLRLDCMPGIVCLPQVMGRNSLSYRQWIDLDLKYRKQWCLMLDFEIIAKTIKIILSPLFSSKHSGY